MDGCGSQKSGLWQNRKIQYKGSLQYEKEERDHQLVAQCQKILEYFYMIIHEHF